MNKEYLKELIEKEGNSLEWNYTCSNGVIISCSIHRNDLKALCGYIFLTKDNSLYGVDYEHIDIHAHGGINYCRYDENENWVIGFDCGHYGDLTPYFILGGEYDCEYDFGQDGIYRDMEYVKSECESMAEQASVFSKSIVRYNKISQII
jgi:hypothetical protein